MCSFNAARVGNKQDGVIHVLVMPEMAYPSPETTIFGRIQVFMAVLAAFQVA